MKKLIILLTITFVSTTVFAQSAKYSIGLVGTHFHNDSNDNRISKADNPYGYGLVLTNNITKDFSLALSGEYLQDNFQNSSAKAKDLRFHFSAIVHPFDTEFIQPYFTGGFVFTHRMIEYTDNLKSDENDNLINGRLGVGANVPIFANLFLNGDLGVYSDGYGYVGWGSTIGFRVGL